MDGPPPAPGRTLLNPPHSEQGGTPNQAPAVILGGGATQKNIWNNWHGWCAIQEPGAVGALLQPPCDFWPANAETKVKMFEFKAMLHE